MKDGKPWVSFGVMGGDHQAQGHTQVVVTLIDFGMKIQGAGEAAMLDPRTGVLMGGSDVRKDGLAIGF
jgi:gamma-glutamyltranspeptidase/glutathione hydrolase